MRGIQQIFFPLANLYNKDEITEDYRQSRLKSSDTIDVPNYLHVVGETTTITLLTFPGGDGGSWGGGRIVTDANQHYYEKGKCYYIYRVTFVLEAEV